MIGRNRVNILPFASFRGLCAASDVDFPANRAKSVRYYRNLSSWLQSSRCGQWPAEAVTSAPATASWLLTFARSAEKAPAVPQTQSVSVAGLLIGLSF
jgi:hypothetical protein